ncbi:hypothetical protein RI129_003194 [Pyrocoelia pectoralis]|uniref:THAP-type domain-containing protein n=1 Tax=Pyrocoelia pectoralis TaxID=417401 RepID=A0AAN7ZMM8_9COLE
MGRKCVVPNCRSGYNKNPEKVTLFVIPKDSLQQYNRAIPRKDRHLTEKDHVCEKHFKPESIIRELKTACYTIPLKVPKLQKGAIPSIFPNCPKYVSKNLPQKRRGIVKHYDGAVKRKKSDLETETQISEASVSTEEMETYEGAIVDQQH